MLYSVQIFAVSMLTEPECNLSCLFSLSLCILQMIFSVVGGNDTLGTCMYQCNFPLQFP